MVGWPQARLIEEFVKADNAVNNFYDRICAETSLDQKKFMEIPLLERATNGGLTRDLYLAFLGQAYHHVKHTCPLLREAMAKCGADDDLYRAALDEYIREEEGHQIWVLDDIAALGGDADAVRDGLPGVACRLMVAYAYYAINNISAYSFLGMVFVLEGVSVALASKVAVSTSNALAMPGVDSDGAGFSYLTSHGELDKDHIAFFADTVNQIDDPQIQNVVIDAAQIIYQLYGDMFREL